MFQKINWHAYKNQNDRATLTGYLMIEVLATMSESQHSAACGVQIKRKLSCRFSSPSEFTARNFSFKKKKPCTFRSVRFVLRISASTTDFLMKLTFTCMFHTDIPPLPRPALLLCSKKKTKSHGKNLPSLPEEENFVIICCRCWFKSVKSRETPCVTRKTQAS